MSWKLLEEAFNTVENINLEIYEENSENKFVMDRSGLLEIYSDGEGVAIEFLGEEIWNSEDDNYSDRYIEDMDDYLPLENYIKVKIKEYITNILKIKFNFN